MISVVKREPITKVEDAKIKGYYDDCGFWCVTNKENNITTRFYASNKLCYKSEDYILGFLHGHLYVGFL